MTIICGPIIGTINGSNSILCDITLRIYDIQPDYSTIDVEITGLGISVGVGTGEGNSFTLNNQRYNIALISKDVSNGTAIVEVTVASLPVSTHYIEYDYSFLPESFLNLVDESIVSISNGIGEYLPMPSNIQYVKSEFVNKKFRIYIIYTLPVLTGNYKLLSNWEILPLIELPIIDFARIVSTIVIFATCQMLLVEALGLGTVVSIIIAAVGSVVLDFAIYNIDLSSSETGNANVSPDQQIEAIRTFANDTRTRCGLLTPGCNDNPVTCDSVAMGKYNICTGALNIEERINDDKQSGTYNETVVNTEIAKVLDRDVRITDGTITPQQAKTEIDNDTDAVVANSEGKQALTTCDTGFVYNPDTKSCVLKENCTIRNPFGGCILSKSTSSKILTAGALIVGGYVVFKLLTMKKS